MAQAKSEKPASMAKTDTKMGRGTNFAIMLMPISFMILSLLRCGQYISENVGISYSDFSFMSLSSGLGSLISPSLTTVVHRKLDADTYTCDQSYTIELLSIDPLVMYINNFMRDEEIDHILNLANDTYQPSVVFAGSDGFREVLNRTMRSSENTVLPKDDIVSQCLTRRMHSLLGNVQHVEVEALQVVKYAQGGDHYNAHTDWFDAPKFDLSYSSDKERRNSSDASNRLGSIFAYLEDNCERGETYFPHLPSVLKTADGNKFALAAGDTGLLVKPRRGNAIFWNNLHANGTGDERTAHLGLPVTSGTKIGLNIWSRYFLDTVMVGGD